MPSIFSRIVAGELPAYKVAEDEHHLAFLDITPLVEGHTLVMPKREVDYIFDLPANELAALHQFAQRVARGVKEAVPCRRVGVAVIGLEVPHAHIHLIPMNRVSDMNFANEKIKVREERMKELAAAISAKIAEASGGEILGAKPAAAAGSQAPQSAQAAGDTDAAVEQLRALTDGLYFVSESESALTPVSYNLPAGFQLSPDNVLPLLGHSPASTNVETQELTYFLRNHTADQGVLGNVELANRFKALQMFMKQEMEDTQVYRVGSGAQIEAYVLGKTSAGKLAGFKATLIET
ncbi:HIT domain-containing protein [Hymenobacter oligotrophus]|uniref:HIT domain-containing protein n=1 Tax=Hymenobacter oligotrophus TaxID=2319843 RepID=A0A3B7RR39_9BACT|nr:nuclease A inhibitor family protein [Hymenobacter oligotrophus]AYA36617.1 HIT domain-containing protein [Hymenobacter oligotrophus]